MIGKRIQRLRKSFQRCPQEGKGSFGRVTLRPSRPRLSPIGRKSLSSEQRTPEVPASRSLPQTGQEFWLSRRFRKQTCLFPSARFLPHCLAAFCSDVGSRF